MPDNLRRSLQASSFLLVMSGYLALITTQRYTAALAFAPLLFYALAPLGEYLDANSPWYRRITAAVSLLSLGAAIVSLTVLDLLTSVTLLVMYIQAYTLMHRKRISNYHHLHLMAFFLLLAAFVQSPDPEIAPVIGLFVFSAIAALMALHACSELARNEGIGLGEILPLGVFDNGMPAFDTPRHVRGVAAVFAAIAVACFVLMVGIFYLTPRMEAGLLGRSDPVLFQTGPSRTVDLSKGGTIQQSQTPVMHVEFPEEPGGRYPGEMYWRATALDDYQNGQWHSKGVSSIRTEPAYSVPVSDIVASNTGFRGVVERGSWDGAQMVRQSIYMDDTPEDGLPCLTMVERVSVSVNRHAIRLGWSDRGDFSVIILRRGPQRWIQYEAWSDVRRFSPEQLRNAPDRYRELLSAHDYERLTYHDLLPETRRLAQDLTRDQQNVYDKASAINAYLSGSAYLYTLTLPPLPPDHPIDAFIHQTRRGHCELYASALALMLRSLGVPTRVVAGYRGGEWNDSDAAYTVRADMAHLWVEVFFPGYGWITFDPSPRGIESLAARNRLAQAFSRQVLRAKIFWYRDVIGFDRTLQLNLFRNAGLQLFGLGSELFGAANPGQAIPTRASWLLPASAIVLICAVLAAWRKRSRARAHSWYAGALTSDQRRAVTLYGGLRRRLRRMGISVTGLTAGEIQQHIEAAPIVNDVSAVRELLETYNQVRFGGRPLSRERYASLKRLLRSIEFRGRRT